MIIAYSFILKPVANTFLVETYSLPSGSMKPTLLAGDYLLADKLIYQIRDPVRGDLAIFKYPKDEKKSFLKRIVGLPGEEIEIRDNRVYINGVFLKEDYIAKNGASFICRQLTQLWPGDCS